MFIPPPSSLENALCPIVPRLPFPFFSLLPPPLPLPPPPLRLFYAYFNSVVERGKNGGELNRKPLATGGGEITWSPSRKSYTSRSRYFVSIAFCFAKPCRFVGLILRSGAICRSRRGGYRSDGKDGNNCVAVVDGKSNFLSPHYSFK